MSVLSAGVRLHDLVTDMPKTKGNKLADIDASAVQLTVEKVCVGFDYKSADALFTVKNIKEEIEKAGKKVSVLSCYINPLSDNYEEEEKRFKKYVDFAAYCGIERVGTETGSAVFDFRKDYQFNYSERIFMRLVDHMKGLISYAAERGVRVGIEGVVYFPVCSAESIHRFVHAFDQDNIDIIYDPVNLLHESNYQNYKKEIDKFINLNADKIKVVHLKDFTIKSGKLIHVPLYSGEFDIDYLLHKIIEAGIDADMIIEGADNSNYQLIYNKLTERINSFAR